MTKIHFNDLVKPFNSIWSFLLGGIIGGMVISIIFGNTFSFNSLLLGTIWSFTIWVTQWLGHAYLAYLITLNFSWQKYKWKTVIFRVITLVLYSLVAFFVVQCLLLWIFVGPITHQTIEGIITVFPIVLGISFFVSTVLGLIEFYQHWQITVLEHQKVKAEMMTYKYDSLRDQINPHFLFNSLNVLSDLVIEDQQLAVKFIRQLSLLYRYVLDNNQKELLPLSEELHFIESYKFLLETRFESGLKIILPVEHKNQFVVPMSVQLLIENSVKHNVVSATRPLVVEVICEGDYLVVRNNFQPKETGEHSSGKGLENIVSRYQFFTDRPVLINQKMETFEVKIPLLEKT